MPNSANCVPTNQRALRAAQLRCPLPFHSAARATVRDKRQFAFRGSCQFQEHSSVIPPWILASVTSTRLISVTDHRASASSHARRPLEHPELHATPSRRGISPATPVYFLYPESILFHVRFPTYNALPPRRPGLPSRLPSSTGALTPDLYRKVPSASSSRARVQHEVLDRVITPPCRSPSRRCAG